jgi:hypothetical protein
MSEYSPNNYIRELTRTRIFSASRASDWLRVLNILKIEVSPNIGVFLLSWQQSILDVRLGSGGNLFRRRISKEGLGSSQWRVAVPASGHSTGKRKRAESKVRACDNASSFILGSLREKAKVI